MQENESIFVEYASVVDIAILATSRHPTGKDTAFYLAYNLANYKSVLYIHYSFYIHPMTHWFDKMDYHLNWLHNCGLWDEIIQRSRYNHVFKLIEFLVHKALS